MRWQRSMLAAVALIAAGCRAKPTPAAPGDTLTTRARQEAIGRSGIPGATGINRALQVADSAAARNSRLDSVPQ